MGILKPSYRTIQPQTTHHSTTNHII